MNIVDLIAWVIVLCAAIVGLAAKDWRTNAVSLACAILALVLYLAGRR
jgi:hypothetical protein